MKLHINKVYTNKLQIHTKGLHIIPIMRIKGKLSVSGVGKKTTQRCNVNLKINCTVKDAKHKVIFNHYVSKNRNS